MRKTIFGIITFCIATLICIVGGEIIAQYYYNPQIFGNDERNLLYEYNEDLGWFPIPNAKTEFLGSRSIQVNNNSLGFRDIEFGEKKKKRIAFVGDSFLWGYDVEEQERFTDKLRPLLPDHEVLNLGVSGYGTDQELLLLKKWFDRLQPDVVFLLFFSANDFVDNSTNELFGYFKPYFSLEKNNELKLKGIPVPVSQKYFKKKYPKLHKSKLFQFLYYTYHSKNKSDKNPTIPLLKACNDFVTSKGSTFYLAFVGEADHKDHCQICETENIKNVFVNNTLQYPTHGNHWTPEGHDYVAEKLYDFIIGFGDDL